MCGIWCSIISRISSNTTPEDLVICPVCSSGESSSTELQNEVFNRTNELVRRRGPDLSTEKYCFPIPIFPDFQNATRKDARIHFSGHVLWTQGPQPVPQPYVSQDLTKYLMFNGDIYSFTGSTDYQIDSFNPSQENDGLHLFHSLQQGQSNFEANLIRTISKLRGPYAFIYYDKTSNEIWFGRDFFGRQSLLFSFDSGGNLTWNISSVSVFPCFEIPTAGIYKFSLDTGTIKLIPFRCHDRQDVSGNLGKFSEFLQTCGISFSEDSPKIELSFSTKLEVKDSIPALEELMALSKSSLSAAEVLIKATEILDPYVSKFLEHLRRSVQLRLKAVAPYCKDCVGSLSPCGHSQVGVLFSGGLDSTVLAYLAVEYLQRVDLLNVAFAKSKNGDFSQVPDRETALQSFQMLRRIFPPKEIQLVLINESKEDVENMRKERIRELILPLKSVIDDSLGCCLWFAASGRGVEGQGQPKEGPYNSPVRTVLLGSGADELLGGYSRHRSAYEKSSWVGLTAEMQTDLDRISIRNMGRDNRVVSDHGICPRMPFLDEGVVNFLTEECATWVKCCPPLGARGLGEKLLLRATAVKLFGVENVHIALFPKRAMQFGSKIAKLENSKEKGNDDCDRLL